MMTEYDMEGMRGIKVPILQSDLRTWVGHGHYRDFNRERPERDAKKKKRRKEKMSKTSRKRNRRKKHERNR